MDNSL